MRYYRALWQDPGRSLFFTPPPIAIRNSLIFALATVLLSLALGTAGAYLLANRDPWLRRIIAWLDPLLVLPLGASAVTLGFGYLVAFGRPPLNWVASPAIVPVVHALIAFPFVLRSCAMMPRTSGIIMAVVAVLLIHMDRAAVTAKSSPDTARKLPLPTRTMRFAIQRSSPTTLPRGWYSAFSAIAFRTAPAFGPLFS